MHICPWKKQQIRAQDTGDSAACADHRDERIRTCQGMGIGSEDPAGEIEDKKPQMTQHILYIIAEYPQIEHVASKMKKAAVHEHGGKDCQRRMYRLDPFKGQEVVRNCTICIGYFLYP